ncbi:MAG: hypothetical protein MI892_30265 [Desulfobacterales bacterium]|nr:hypothetical protein [Desulfobacterales bacterium]
MSQSCIRQILPNVKDFKRFWKEKGPFKYALTSSEFPPVLLEPEEWIFGNDRQAVLKELMQFNKQKMAVVPAPFNPDNKNILRPDEMCAWKITHFPEEWNVMVCDAFLPEGQLSQAVLDECISLGLAEDKAGIETSFFTLLEKQLDNIGYIWLKPEGKSKFAAIRKYLDEWESDEADAGLL